MVVVSKRKLVSVIFIILMVVGIVFVYGYLYKSKYSKASELPKGGIEQTGNTGAGCCR